MNVVGKVGSLISQGVYSVATPFHPFGGAVDVIVVEQQDGTYRSTPWYVRFGKFQGVLKGAEKIVRIAVNGVEANFHMYLDNSGEAYFIREVVSGKDSESAGVFKNSGDLEVTGEDNDNSNNNNVDSNEINVSLCRNESDASNLEDECVSFGNDQIESTEVDNEDRLYEFQDQQSSLVDSVESTSYQAYHYGSLNQVEDVVESQGSDSEVVLISVDGHLLTAPISASEQDTDNLQLSTPQFHLGPGEGADFRDSEDYSTGQDGWAAEYLSEVSAPNDLSEGAPNDAPQGVPTDASEGVEPTGDDGSTFGNASESPKCDGQLVNQAEEIHNLDSIESDTVEHIYSEDTVTTMNKNDIFKSCLELTDLHFHAEDAESQDICSPSMEVRVEENENIGDSQDSCQELAGLNVNAEDVESQGPCSPCMEVRVKENENIEVSPENSPLSTQDNKDGSESPAESLLHKSGSPCNNNALDLSIDVDARSALTIDNSDSVSLHSVNNDQDWKDEQSMLTPHSQELESSPGRYVHNQECSIIETVEPQTGSFDVGMRSNAGLGFEISLCGNLLRACMGLGPASETFDAYRISVEEFKASASSITKDENLIVRFKGKYFSWEKAAPIVLGIAAFGLDLHVEPKDAIPVEQDETPKPKEGTPGLTPSPSGRRWRLWPIPFRRVKTIQHTNSTSSNEEVFVDSESGSQNPHVEPTPASGAVNESPRKQLVRTNIPTTEQIASLNLRDGQNMITFSFSTRVLGTQQVDAHIYLWKWNARIVISDVDGTITRSDVLGQFMPLVGKDWSQSGVARLFTAIKENGYQLLFLSARAIVQAYLTRSFLLNLKQDGKTLPNGPVVISPDGLFPSLFREVIRRAPHEFKIACLEDIKALFPSDYNPFYAGFGNRDTDELSYRKIGIPKGKIFIINPKGEVAISHRIDVKSYTSLHTLVNDMFPPTSLVEQEDFNSWNYWKMPLPNIDL